MGMKKKVGSRKYQARAIFEKVYGTWNTAAFQDYNFRIQMINYIDRWMMGDEKVLQLQPYKRWAKEAPDADIIHRVLGENKRFRLQNDDSDDYASEDLDGDSCHSFSETSDTGYEEIE